MTNISQLNNWHLLHKLYYFTHFPGNYSSLYSAIAFFSPGISIPRYYSHPQSALRTLTFGRLPSNKTTNSLFLSLWTLLRHTATLQQTFCLQRLSLVDSSLANGRGKMSTALFHTLSLSVNNLGSFERSTPSPIQWRKKMPFVGN